MITNNSPIAVFDRWEVIKPYVKSKKVLDVGPAELVATSTDTGKRERWLFGKLNKNAKSVVGIDINQEQVEELQQQDYDVRLGDAENFKLKEKFEIIVAGELLEHLSNPGLALDNFYHHLQKGGKLIITTPNRFDLRIFIKALRLNVIPGYKKNIAKHVHYYDQESLKALLERYHFEPIFVGYYASFGTGYDSPLTKIWLKSMARFRPQFIRGLVVVAEKAE